MKGVGAGAVSWLALRKAAARERRVKARAEPAMRRWSWRGGVKWAARSSQPEKEGVGDSAVAGWGVGVWCLAFGVWRSAFGVWRSAFGVGLSAFGVRCSAFGDGLSAFGFWLSGGVGVLSASLRVTPVPSV